MILATDSELSPCFFLCTDTGWLKCVGINGQQYAVFVEFLTCYNCSKIHSRPRTFRHHCVSPNRILPRLRHSYHASSSREAFIPCGTLQNVPYHTGSPNPPQTLFLCPYIAFHSPWPLNWIILNGSFLSQGPHRHSVYIRTPLLAPVGAPCTNRQSLLLWEAIS